jgi:predicted GIY-YIG superfamily endonuclease
MAQDIERAQMSNSAVYVIAATEGHIKVGVSTDPRKRMASLQCGWPTKLQLAHVENVEGLKATAVERAAHALLHEVHSHGEWFTTDVDRAVAAIRQAAQELRNQAANEPTQSSDDSPVNKINEKRLAAVRIIEEGEATTTEVARMVGTSHQLVSYWVKHLNVAQIRANYLASIWQETLAGEAQD